MGYNDPHRFVRRDMEQDYLCLRCGETVSEYAVDRLDRQQKLMKLYQTQCWTKEEKEVDKTDQARFVAWLGG